ncbi:MAG: NADH-quinone oxidoreductase subunit E, partial [Bacteroidales bacterium]|nr:NADH-quinone oxidoreductase subunit E [Bacteroidales bacterium]
MGALIFITFLFSALLLFIIPRSLKYIFTLIITAGMVILTSIWSFEAFSAHGHLLEIRFNPAGIIDLPVLSIDRLSAFFLVVINITVFTGIIFAKGYLKSSEATRQTLQISIHYFAYLWLYFSMILVVTLRDGFGFLIVWELMSLSSFLLVIFEAEDRATLKTGINYLIQMHVGFALLLVAFLITEKATGEMSFDALTLYFSSNPNILLFFIFFVGFGIKAGFMPLHTWLPDAHPAAPSHVSGVMSGVMIKMGIYGILRVLLAVQ